MKQDAFKDLNSIYQLAVSGFSIFGDVTFVRLFLVLMFCFLITLLLNISQEKLPKNNRSGTLSWEHWYFSILIIKTIAAPDGSLHVRHSWTIDSCCEYKCLFILYFSCVRLFSQVLSTLRVLFLKINFISAFTWSFSSNIAGGEFSFSPWWWVFYRSWKQEPSSQSISLDLWSSIFRKSCLKQQQKLKAGWVIGFWIISELYYSKWWGSIETNWPF